MKKNVLIGTARNGHVRVSILNAKEMVEKARTLHDLWPTSCAALGRTLAVTALMALRQKDDEEVVTVTINGNGPIGTILCVGQSNGRIKGFCGNPHIYETYPDSHKLAVGLAVGTDGYLKVTKNLKLKQNYTSEVHLQSGEIGDDFAYYFLISEQVPSIVAVGVLVDSDDSVKSAGAMIIELLPDHEEEDIRYLENLKLEPISAVLERNDDLYAYMSSLFDDFVVLKEEYACYHCDCSKERFLRNLLTLSKEDLQEIAKEKELEIKCEFCDKTYCFDENDIKTVMSYAKNK
ncbi:MAG: Hsp33 family molecular chaperone HslO [Erysipelotrichaceae bacterium]|nr:Hsp33 family molecular chaperone HslO [Erysipelotrichaceae bacterium]